MPFPEADKGVKILPSKLGDNAGITGGAVLARRETKPRAVQPRPTLCPAPGAQSSMWAPTQ